MNRFHPFQAPLLSPSHRRTPRAPSAPPPSRLGDKRSESERSSGSSERGVLRLSEGRRVDTLRTNSQESRGAELGSRGAYWTTPICDPWYTRPFFLFLFAGLQPNSDGLGISDTKPEGGNWRSLSRIFLNGWSWTLRAWIGGIEVFEMRSLLLFWAPVADVYIVFFFNMSMFKRRLVVIVVWSNS